AERARRVFERRWRLGDRRLVHEPDRLELLRGRSGPERFIARLVRGSAHLRCRLQASALTEPAATRRGTVGSNGKATSKRVPLSTSDDTDSWPLCRSTIIWHRLNPKPMPRSFVVMDAVNRLGRRSGSMPTPESST